MQMINNITLIAVKIVRKKYNLVQQVQSLILLDMNIKIEDIRQIIRFSWNILYDLKK